MWYHYKAIKLANQNDAKRTTEKHKHKQNMTQCNSIRVPVKWQKNSLVEICWSNIRYGTLNEASTKKKTASIR